MAGAPSRCADEAGLKCAAKRAAGRGVREAKDCGGEGPPPPPPPPPPLLLLGSRTSSTWNASLAATRATSSAAGKLDAEGAGTGVGASPSGPASANISQKSRPASAPGSTPAPLAHASLTKSTGHRSPLASASITHSRKPSITRRRSVADERSRAASSSLVFSFSTSRITTSAKFTRTLHCSASIERGTVSITQRLPSLAPLEATSGAPA